MSDVLNLPNSIWPNGIKVDDDGYAVFYPLGTNKIEVPTDSSSWPTGDKLVSPFVYQNDRLVGFCDTMAMTVSGNTTITMPYEHIEADFASISEGKLTVNAPNATVKKFKWGGYFDFVIIDFNTTVAETINTVRTAKRVVDNELYDAEGGLIGTIDTSKIKVGGIFDYAELRLDGLFCNGDILSSTQRGLILSEFNSDLSSLRDGSCMFTSCTSLTSFTADLSSLTVCSGMFDGCSNLTTFTADLSSLTDGTQMFGNCSSLTTFTADLSSLTNGGSMFSGCSNLTSYNFDLPNLTDGFMMFDNCRNFTSFTTDLPSLTDGEDMFGMCSNLTSFDADLSNLANGHRMFYGCRNLTSFSSDLPSLTDGYWMFIYCKLDAPSVKNIIDTINTYSARLRLGIGCNDTTEDEDIFAQEVGYDNMTALLAALQAKGWTVTVEYNGRPTTTYGLRRTPEDTLPVFVKLEELEETEDHANYTSMDGSKKYKLDWFHKTTGSTEGYTQFNSLEEAIETLNIKPIERN